MSFIILRYLIIALPLIIQSVTGKEFIKERHLIENMAKKGEFFLNGKLELLPNGYSKCGEIGFFWSAIYEKFQKILVKFIPKIEGEVDHGLRECECYEALNAIQNPNIKEHGILEIHFCEEVLEKNFYVIGMPLHDPIEKNFEMKPKEAGQQLSDQEAVDVLLLAEYATLHVNYAHSRRVQHRNIKPTSFVLCVSQLFLIDWSSGERTDRIDSYKPISGKSHESQKDAEKKPSPWTDDVKNLFNVFLVWAKVKKNLSDSTTKTQNNNNELLECCNGIGHAKLKEFCKIFYVEAYQAKGDHPQYNKIVAAAAFYIRDITRSNNRAFYHWLNESEIANAKKANWPSFIIPKPPYDGPPPLPNVRLVDQNVIFPTGFRVEDRVQLEIMAANGILLNDKIKLLGKKHIGIGASSIVWKGHFNGKDVAVKCIPHELKELINNEFENHLKMKAYENTNIERFGIPDLKYSGTTFDGRIHVFCFTFLESSEEKFNMKNWKHGQPISDAEAVNILNLMKYAIIPMKLAHSVDLKHMDLKLDCLYLHGCQVFILDWNMGEIGYKGAERGNGQYGSRRGIFGHQCRLIDDIEALFNIFLTYAKINGLWESAYEHMAFEARAVKIKNKFEEMRNHCDEIGHKVLRRYCREFFDQAYIPEWPNYEILFHLPDKYLEEITGSSAPVYFQWLKGKKLEDAKKFKWPSLNEIPEPPHHTPPPTPSGSEASSDSESNSSSDSRPPSSAGHAVPDTSSSHPSGNAGGNNADNMVGNTANVADKKRKRSPE